MQDISLEQQKLLPKAEILEAKRHVILFSIAFSFGLILRLCM